MVLFQNSDSLGLLMLLIFFDANEMMDKAAGAAIAGA